MAPPAVVIPTRGAIASWLELYGPQSEAAIEAHLGSALSFISACIGWKAWIQWAENREPATINVILEGRSALGRKTTVTATAHHLARQAMRDIPKPEALLRTRSFSHTSERGLLEAVAAPDQTTADEWEKTPPPGNFIDWDEFGAILGRPGDVKGADWLGRVRTTLMQITNGRHGGIQTGQGKLPAGRCAASILGTMTRQELEARVSTGLLRDGFMGRFVLIPHNGRARYLAEPLPWTAGMIEQRDALVQWFRDLAQSREVLGNAFDRFEDDAHELRADWYEKRSRQLDDRADATMTEVDQAVAEAFGRLQTTAVKVATVVAVSEWSPPQSLAQLTITREHVAYGIAFADLALEEIRSLAGAGDRDLPLEAANRAADYIARNGPTQRKELLDNVRISGLTRTATWNAIRDTHGDLLTIRQVNNTGGRPAEVVELNEERL